MLSLFMSEIQFHGKNYQENRKIITVKTQKVLLFDKTLVNLKYADK
jgi:hypothetical protein